MSTHRAAVAAGDAAAEQDRVDRQASELERPARLRQRAAPPAVSGHGHSSPAPFRAALCVRLPSFAGAGLSAPERSASQAVQSGHQLPRLIAAAVEPSAAGARHPSAAR